MAQMPEATAELSGATWSPDSRQAEAQKRPSRTLTGPNPCLRCILSRILSPLAAAVSANLHVPSLSLLDVFCPTFSHCIPSLPQTKKHSAFLWLQNQQISSPKPKCSTTKFATKPHLNQFFFGLTKVPPDAAPRRAARRRPCCPGRR